MKASEYGGHVPQAVGQVAYAKSEDGCGDGVWHQVTSSEAAAIAELTELISSDGLTPTHGYLADVVEVSIFGMDAAEVVEDLGQQAYVECGDVADGWLSKVPKEHVAELTESLDKAVGAWLTKHDLWPRFTLIENIRRVELAPPAEQPREGGNGD